MIYGRFLLISSCGWESIITRISIVYVNDKSKNYCDLWAIAILYTVNIAVVNCILLVVSNIIVAIDMVVGRNKLTINVGRWEVLQNGSSHTAQNVLLQNEISRILNYIDERIRRVYSYGYLNLIADSDKEIQKKKKKTWKSIYSSTIYFTYNFSYNGYILILN